MPEVQLGRHTVRSHGMTIARVHMHDWLILLLLVVLEVGLNFIEPFHRFVGEEMMTDLKYPLQGNTVPFWSVPVIAVLLPFAVILVYYFRRRDVYDLHHALLGLLFSVLITGVITDAIKDAVGRPRPDFFWRCFPDGKGVYRNVTRGVMCTGDKAVIKEGYKSFPSGHTSWSFAGLSFLAWYLSGKVRVFDRQGHIAKLCIVFLPLLMAALVGVSRVDDYWHHWQDVFSGAIIGMIVASFCYLQFFPPPYDIDGNALRKSFPNASYLAIPRLLLYILNTLCIGRAFEFFDGSVGWGPHAYFQMLAETGSGPQAPSSAANQLNVRRGALENRYIDPEQGAEMSRTTSRDSIPILGEPTSSNWRR